jgi:hypothetical protein
MVPRPGKCKLCDEPLARHELRERYCDTCLRANQWMPGTYKRQGVLRAADAGDLNPIGEEAFKQLGRVRKP